MNIKKLRELQIKQDEQIGFNVKFNSINDKYDQITKDLVGLFGEIGEFSNIVKKINLKISNNNYEFDIVQAESHLKEEWVDSFIYLLRISAILGIDIEIETLKKMEYNSGRFKNLKKQ
ncbi:hypothetical protein NUN95_001507 [Klebsiella aerogenes]|uniref:hypothetical protein n=1 Tax=Klebsiella aerogenes TaxID=548 RepID=UPI000668DDF1|nr:hypothetical protein [Klebsiella aerogenes]EKU6608483.1 hypothetical protein [Klebsiella aerogenes]